MQLNQNDIDAMVYRAQLAQYLRQPYTGDAEELLALLMMLEEVKSRTCHTCGYVTRRTKGRQPIKCVCCLDEELLSQV